MFKKTICVLVLSLVYTVSAGYIGDPNASNKWDTRSSVKVITPDLLYPSITQVWTESPGPEVVINGLGIDPSGTKHSTANYSDWSSAYIIQNTTGETAPKYAPSMNAAGLAWFAFEFDQIYKISNVEIWQYNGAGKYGKIFWGAKDITISHSIDKNNWVENSIYIMNEANGKGWDAGDDALYPEIIPIDANAKYVVITINNNHSDIANTRTGLSEVRFKGEPVPEPTIMVLASIGGIALLRKRYSLPQ